MDYGISNELCGGHIGLFLQFTNPQMKLVMDYISAVSVIFYKDMMIQTINHGHWNIAVSMQDTTVVTSND